MSITADVQSDTTCCSLISPQRARKKYEDHVCISLPTSKVGPPYRLDKEATSKRIFCQTERTARTYERGHSVMVTHVATSPSVRCFYGAERTGNLVVSSPVDTHALLVLFTESCCLTTGSKFLQLGCEHQTVNPGITAFLLDALALMCFRGKPSSLLTFWLW